MKKPKLNYSLLSVFILLVTLHSKVAVCQNKWIGYWTGTMERDSSTMNVSFVFKMQNNQTLGFFNSSSQKASGIPLDSIRNNKDSLFFQLMSDLVTYFKCKVFQNKIDGQIVQDGFSTGNLSLTQTTLPTTYYSFIDTIFKSGDHKIACRIYFPKADGKFPGVIFMHGSGSEGMFANQYLAEYLASKGIITLIQDKQGVGRSTGNWTKATFDDLANDYIQAKNFLKNFNKVNQNQIGIYGHSQGGTIAPLVASKSKDISFIIAAASVGDTVYKQDLYRVENNLKSNGFNSCEISAAMAYYKSWLDMARTGIGFEKLDNLNLFSKDKKWFGWVEAPPKNHWIWKYYLATGNYNSLDYWKMITVPVLLVYGESDEIEDIHNYIRNIDNILIKQQRDKDVTQLILPKAQHNLCVFPEKNDKFFWWYLSPGFQDIVASWILYRFKN
jgi:Dipeptidyl aminopeptidases/acylaminoacyl-peptidases